MHSNEKSRKARIEDRSRAVLFVESDIIIDSICTVRSRASSELNDQIIPFSTNLDLS